MLYRNAVCTVDFDNPVFTAMVCRLTETESRRAFRRSIVINTIAITGATASVAALACSHSELGHIHDQRMGQAESEGTPSRVSTGCTGNKLSSTLSPRHGF